MKKLFAIVLALTLLATFAATAEVVETGKTKISYSKSQGPYTELFEEAIIPIMEAEGYTFDVLDTSELLLADHALNNGEVDVNVEQHTAYINTYNANNNGDLVGISVIPTVPAALYSVNHASLDEVADGMTVAVPNDASNTARCLMILSKIGWIKFDESVDPSAVTVDDIIENPYNLDFTEQKSLTIPAAIEDYDFVAITGAVVWNAKDLLAEKNAVTLAYEDVLPHLILQVTVKEDNANTDWAQAIVAAYHSDAFKAYMAENNDGMWWIPEELQ